MFLALVAGGELVLLPALRLYLHRPVELSLVAATAVLAALTSDLFWYSVGRWGARLPALERRRAVVRARSGGWVPASHFESHWKKLLVLSKFVYGARATAQVVCGATQRPFRQYLIVNTIGTTLLILYLLASIALFARGFTALDRWPGVAAAVAATLALSLVVGRTAWFVYRRHSRL